MIMCSVLHCRLGLNVLLFFLSHHVYYSIAYSERIPQTFCRTLMRDLHTRTPLLTQKKTQESIFVVHMRYAVFEPAIPFDSVKIFAVYYSQNTTAACHNLSPTT